MCSFAVSFILTDSLKFECSAFLVILRMWGFVVSVGGISYCVFWTGSWPYLLKTLLQPVHATGAENDTNRKSVLNCIYKVNFALSFIW